MRYSAQFLNPSEAAQELCISTKALRLYEQRGLIAPARTAAGWRAYGPADMARAAEIVALRDLGLSLAQVARVLKGDSECLEPALAVHQTMLEGQARRLAEKLDKVRLVRTELATGRAPGVGELARFTRPVADFAIAFDLPWPWGGERFELSDIRSLNYITGPLGSGKTRFARALADSLPDAAFIGLERLAGDGTQMQARLDAQPALNSRVNQILALLAAGGAIVSAPLVALVVAMEAEEASILVVDMIEQGLDRASQEALAAYLRRRGPAARSLFLLTRSCAILDLGAVTLDEAIILCPANHGPPWRVPTHPGAPGYEAVATCLASPDVRARTEGVVAWRPQEHEDRRVTPPPPP